jgi:SNF2 family DNA or RNA helicase
VSKPIRVERVGDRIHLRGWCGPDTPTKCKSVGGGRFSKKDGAHWSYPLAMPVCRRLREVFGDQLEIGPDLNAWARIAVAEERKLAALALATEASLERVPLYAPRCAAAMSTRRYQQVAAAFARDAGNFLLADEQGLGKTIETLAGLLENTPDPFEVRYHLIFAPKVAVRGVWEPEVQHWLGDLAATYALAGTRPERNAKLAAVGSDVLDAAVRHVFVIGNIEMARIKPTYPNGKRHPKYLIENAEYPQLFEREWDTIIVDESHRALIRTSGTPTQTRAGFSNLRSVKRIAISGTPMRGKPEQMWGTLNWLRPDLFTSYWRWVERYFKITSDGYSDYVLTGPKEGALDKMHTDLAPIMLRRTKAGVLPELPPKQYAGTFLYPGDEHSPHGVWLDMTPAHRKQYERFIKDAEIDFEDGEFLMANGQLAEYTRRKQLSSAVHKLVDGKLTPTLDSPKYEWLLQKFDELGIVEGQGTAKIVVSSQFTSLLKIFAAGLREKGIAVHLLTGESSEKSRIQMVEDFQSDHGSARVFLLNTKAGGVALTLDAADDLVLLDETTIPDDQQQVEDRIHRTSRMHHVTIHYLRVRETQDEEIAWITAARENVMSYVLGGTRGVETARNIYNQKRQSLAEKEGTTNG